MLHKDWFEKFFFIHLRYSNPLPVIPYSNGLSGVPFH